MSLRSGAKLDVYMVIVPRCPTSLKAHFRVCNSQPIFQMRFDEHLADARVAGEEHKRAPRALVIYRVVWPERLQKREVPSQCRKRGRAGAWPVFKREIPDGRARLAGQIDATLLIIEGNVSFAPIAVAEMRQKWKPVKKRKACIQNERHRARVPIRDSLACIFKDCPHLGRDIVSVHQTISPRLHLQRLA